MAREFVYEISKHFGTLSTNAKGWSKELNMVAWNGAKPKLDLRDWSEDHKSSGKGNTLTKDEAKALRDMLNNMDLD